MSGVIRYQGIPFVARFKWSAGELMEKFIQALGEKKLLAAKCRNCGYAVFPPRIRCPKCYAKLSENDLVELSGKGTLLSYTKVYFKLDGKGNFIELEQPEILAAVKLEGTDSTIFVPLRETEKLQEGLKVEVVWREETKGELSDIAYFKVVP